MDCKLGNLSSKFSKSTILVQSNKPALNVPSGCTVLIMVQLNIGHQTRNYLATICYKKGTRLTLLKWPNMQQESDLKTV